jgi:hypothetical protein
MKLFLIIALFTSVSVFVYGINMHVFPKGADIEAVYLPVTAIKNDQVKYTPYKWALTWSNNSFYKGILIGFSGAALILFLFWLLLHGTYRKKI